VLSACETGVGAVSRGEGVYGLRRALVIAGAESQVMSLWQVEDAATRDLMAAYYRRLLRGEGRAEALRQAQREVAGSSGRSHPFFWASFVPIGDWAPITTP
jgi:CHAT domain-containing protein